MRWECACGARLVTHYDPQREGCWVQHGDNPECRVFMLMIDVPEFVGEPLVRWLDSVHDYQGEARRRRTRTGNPWEFRPEARA